MVTLADLSSGTYWEANGLSLGEGNPPEVIMEINEPVMQFYGNVHGGAITGLLDSAIAVAVNTNIPHDYGASTIELKINFMRPATTGKLRAQAQIISQGKSIIVGESRAYNDAGDVVAICLATFKVYKRK